MDAHHDLAVGHLLEINEGVVDKARHGLAGCFLTPEGGIDAGIVAVRTTPLVIG